MKHSQDIYTKPVSIFCGDCMSHLKLMHSYKGETKCYSMSSVI